MNEMMTAAIADLMKKGEIEEFGYFADGTSGYAISKGDILDVFRRVNMFQPYISGEVNEIVPFEKGREIQKAALQAKIAARKR